jgi:hypothetical protein
MIYVAFVYIYKVIKYADKLINVSRFFFTLQFLCEIRDPKEQSHFQVSGKVYVTLEEVFWALTDAKYLSSWKCNSTKEHVNYTPSSMKKKLNNGGRHSLKASIKATQNHRANGNELS